MSDANQLPPDAQSVLQKETSETDPDPRHQRRIRLMQALFSHNLEQSIDLEPEEEEIFQEIVSHLEKLDPQLQEHAPERPLTDINQVDLSILRLSLHEALHTKTPTKVVINEAVELAKEFGTESSPRFVNGVLGQILKAEKEEKDAA